MKTPAITLHVRKRLQYRFHISIIVVLFTNKMTTLRNQNHICDYFSISTYLPHKSLPSCKMYFTPFKVKITRLIP